ncbi:MAG: phosphoribosylformylglycinamidine synthase subunit PurQ, partial [Bacteriovoracaceae bacterium]
SAHIMQLNELISAPQKLAEHDILALPGGFSYGDEIHSGQVYALKLKKHLFKEMQEFIKKDKLILGVCNGFQILVKLGFLPSPLEERSATLAGNRDGAFIDRWEELQTWDSVCVWTKNLPASLFMPARHGEGKLVFAGDEKRQKQIYQKLKDNKQIVFTYTNDINGSYGQIAGLTDPSGRVLGLMPHPEAALDEELNPFNSATPSNMIFANAINHSNQINKTKEGLL